MLFPEYGLLGAVVVEIHPTTNRILLALARLDETSAVSETLMVSEFSVTNQLN